MIKEMKKIKIIKKAVEIGYKHLITKGVYEKNKILYNNWVIWCKSEGQIQRYYDGANFYFQVIRSTLYGKRLWAKFFKLTPEENKNWQELVPIELRGSGTRHYELNASKALPHERIKLICQRLF